MLSFDPSRRNGEQGSPAMADPTVQQIFEQQIPERLASHPNLAGEIDAVVHFQITGEGGGTWTLDTAGGNQRLEAGAHGEPRMVITCSAQDFVKIATRQLNPNMAAMSGKLKFKPMDMGLAMKLSKLLG